MWLNPDVAVTLPFSFLYKDEVFRLYEVFIAFLFISIWKYIFFRYTFCAYGKTLTSHKPIAMGLTGTC